MADVKLNTLPQSTSPTSTQDLLLFDESTNAGQRINYNTLADVILAKLTSKTYTVGGGTQTLISAIDALNSKTYSLTLGTRLTGTVDFNTLTTVGNYYCDTAITATNGPVSSLLGITKIEHSVGHDDNYLIQTYYSARNDADIYRRVRHNGNWGAWDKLPNSRTYSLSGGTQLQANVDLDTLLPGNYYAYSTIAVQHGPFSDICGIVKVEHSAGTDDKYLRQTYRRYNNDIIYERIKDGNTWKDWIKLPARAEVDALNSNQTIKRGDTITFGGTNSMYAGRIGWNGLQIWFSVPMDKPAQESIYFTPSEIGGGNIYCCTANAAQALDRNLISKIEIRMGKGSPHISVCLTLSSNPFSVSDAIMNVMFSGSQSITIP